MLQEHFKHIFWFAVGLVASALLMSVVVILKFGERYTEQIMTFWLLTGGASGVAAVTGVSVSAAQKKTPVPPEGTTTAEINATITSEPK
jgi:hypothetical protein